MDRPTTILSRNSAGLTAGHVALIKVLTEVAVEDFLREIEAPSECITDAHQPDETWADVESRR